MTQRFVAPLALALLGALCVLTWARGGPPPAKSAAAPPEAFSAERAVEVLRRILGEDGPHPVGSRAHATVQERLIRELRGLGLEPTVQQARTCTAWASCIDLQNVIARIPGREAGPGLLLVAHYDSQPAAPGAADDGSGVAALIEIARAMQLRDSPRPERSLIFLFSDAEETGLAGADAFSREHPWRDDVGAVINLESRGSRGASLMFETGPGSGEWVRRFGAHCPRPRGSSLFSSIYDRIPNDTDFTVFKRAGVPGLNFAFVSVIEHYHTPLDNLNNLDPASVQHHGDCALALVRDFAQRGLPEVATDGILSERVYFDLFGWLLISWPVSLAWPLALFALVCVVIAYRRARRGGLSLASLGAATVAWPLCIAAAMFACALGTKTLLALSGSAAPWAAHPSAALIAFAALTGVTFFAGSFAATVYIGPRAFGVANALWFGLLTVLSTLWLPGASYQFVLPAIAFGLASFFEARDGQPGLASLAAATLCAAIHLPAFPLTAEALGYRAAAAAALPAALAIAGFAPALASQLLLRRALVLLLNSVALAAGISIAAGAPYSRERPAELNLLLHSDSTHERSRWLIAGDHTAVSAPLRAAAGLSIRGTAERFGETVERFEKAVAGGELVAGSPLPAASSPEVRVPAVEWVLNERTGDNRRWVLRVRSLRGAEIVGIVIDAAPRRALLNGIEVPPVREVRKRRSQGLNMLRWETATAAPIEFELEFDEPTPDEFIVFDQSYALPAVARATADARGPLAAPKGDGDGWIVSRTIAVDEAR